jgi:hypothetical protein
MQLLAQASKWFSENLPLAVARQQLAGSATYVRMRVHCQITRTPSTTVEIGVSDGGEGWIPIARYTFDGLPVYVGFACSALRTPGASPQGGTFAIDYLRAFEDPREGAKLSTDGGQQFFP